MNLFEKEKLLSNPLYFIAVNGVPDPEKEKRLETEFMADLCSYVSNSEKEAVAEFDMKNKGTGLLIYLDEWKVFRILEFFRHYDLLVSYEIISNPVRFICSSPEYYKAYEEERNKRVLDTYILRNISVDDVLERIHENKFVPGFSLLPVEIEILTGASS